MSTTVKTRSSAPRLALLASSIALLLAGCGSDMDELQAKVDEIKNAPGTGVEPLPEVKSYEAFTYAAFDQLDPFKPSRLEPKFVGGGLEPDPNRRREALEEFPLEDLKMVGTLERKGITYALVRSPDNNLAQVKLGDHVGQQHGRITAISESEIKLREMVQESGGWIERDNTLQLAEEPEQQARAPKQ